MIEDKEIEHYDIHVDPAKKAVTCWIVSEANKVRESLFDIEILFIPTILGVYGCMVGTRR